MFVSAYTIPDGAKFVQIRFLRKDGEVYDLPPGRPVVIAALRYDPEHGTGPRNITGLKSTYALIDTGADHNYATPELIAEAGCPQIGTARLRNASGWTESTQHLAHIFLPETGNQYETDVFSSSLVDDDGHGESLIIGVLVMKTGRLVMDFQSNIYRLYVA
jgi:predicted aspartyl protease